MKLAIGSRQIGLVIDQLIRWFPQRQTALEALRAQCVMGLQIDLAPMKRRATDSQRGAYWSALHAFGMELGYSAKESETHLHDAILCEAYGTKGFREFGASRWPVPAERSSKDAQGNVRDVETYSLLIDTLLRVAAENGVVLEIGEAA